MNQRLDNFRSQINNIGLDGAFIYSDDNRNYISGFTGDDSFILISKDKAYFITDSRYTEQAQNQVKGFEILEYKTSIYDFIADLVKQCGIKNMGIEEDHMTFLDYELYKEKLPDVEFKKLNCIVENLRMIKDDKECGYIERAAEIADKAFEHILGYIKPGMTEEEVGLELEFFMRKMGASKLSFNSIVASGERSSLPHGEATDKVIKQGDLLTLDFGCVYKGYCSDMTRTIVIGKASEKQRQIYNIVLEAQMAALEAMKPGAKCIDVDAAARNIITKNGYGDNFGHGLGHGVGMKVHEIPGVNKRNEKVLEPGMVITDEPGIYIPGFGGVRIEDLILITQDGYKVLSKSPKHLIEL